MKGLSIVKHCLRAESAPLKNKPLPTKQHYLKSMIDKVENFTTRLIWKAFFSRNQTKATPITQQILVSNQTLHQHRMKNIPFENGLYNMIQSIEFELVRNDFQSTLREDQEGQVSQ